MAEVLSKFVTEVKLVTVSIFRYYETKCQIVSSPVNTVRGKIFKYRHHAENDGSWGKC